MSLHISIIGSGRTSRPAASVGFNDSAIGHIDAPRDILSAQSLNDPATIQYKNKVAELLEGISLDLPNS